MCELVSSSEILSELEYQESSISRNCRRCLRSEVINAGGSIPRRDCSLMKRLFKERGIENGDSQVDGIHGTCKCYKNWN